MKKILLLAAIAGFLVPAMQSCYYDNEEELYPQPCPTDNITYSIEVREIIEARCATAGCHITGGTGNGLFEDYAGVKNKFDNGSLRQRVLETRDMPPGGALSTCDIAVLEKWINDNAPNN